MKGQLSSDAAKVASYACRDFSQARFLFRISLLTYLSIHTRAIGDAAKSVKNVHEHTEQ